MDQITVHLKEVESLGGGQAAVFIFDGDGKATVVSQLKLSLLTRMLCLWVGRRLEEFSDDLEHMSKGHPGHDA